MRSARLPFKFRDTDAAWTSATILIPETLWDRLRLLFGPYKLGTSAMFGLVHYDPRSIECSGGEGTDLERERNSR